MFIYITVLPLTLPHTMPPPHPQPPTLEPVTPCEVLRPLAHDSVTVTRRSRVSSTLVGSPYTLRNHPPELLLGLRE